MAGPFAGTSVVFVDTVTGIPIVGGGAGPYEGIPVVSVDQNGNAANPLLNPTVLPNGSGSGVAGTGLSITTGNGGGGNAASGGIAFVMGTPTGNGAAGSFTVTTSAPADRAIPNNRPLAVNQFGVGIGVTPQTAVKNILGLNVTWTDPTGESKASSMSCTIALTANNANPNDTLNPSLYIVDGGFNLTSANGQWSVLSETHVQSPSSGTHAMIGGITGSAWLDAGSTGNATEMRGVQGYVSMGSTATVPLVSGHYSYIQLTPSGGAVDGNITLANGLRCAFANNTSAATPGIITTGEGIRILAPTYSATGTSTTVRGMAVIAQRNTIGSSSTTGGFTGQGIYVEIPNQGGNTSGTNTNYGIYIASNALATPGGGGTVNNWAIRSDSAAPSWLSGLLTISTGGLSIAATGLSIVAGNMVIGSALPTDAGKMLYLHGNSTTGASQYGFYSFGTFGSDATTVGAAFYSQLRTTAAAYVMSNGYGLLVDSPSVGAGSSFTSVAGITINNQGSAAATTSYGLRILAQSGSGTNWSLLIAGGNISLGALDVVLDTATGTKFGTGATQKMSFYGVTPIVQPAASADITGFAAGVGTASKSDSTWTGVSGASAYTVGGIVTRLKALGLLAA